MSLIDCPWILLYRQPGTLTQGTNEISPNIFMTNIFKPSDLSVMPHDLYAKWYRPDLFGLLSGVCSEIPAEFSQELLPGFLWKVLKGFLQELVPDIYLQYLLRFLQGLLDSSRNYIPKIHLELHHLRFFWGSFRCSLWDSSRRFFQDSNWKSSRNSFQDSFWDF